MITKGPRLSEVPAFGKCEVTVLPHGSTAPALSGFACHMVLWIVAALFMAACGGASSKTLPSVTIVESTSWVTGAPIHFTAVETGGTNNCWIWSINGIVGGNASAGTITNQGLYTAPVSPYAGPLTVTVTACTNSALTASATVSGGSVSISPATVTLTSSFTQQFTVSEQGATNDCWIWTVNGIVGGNAAVGTITNTGFYAAPTTPFSGTETITVTSCVNSALTASATLSLGSGTSALKGQYAFSVKGRDSNGVIGRIGSFVADGAGNIQSGVEDVTTAKGTSTIAFSGGNYTIGADGRGTLRLTTDGLESSQFYMSVASDKLAFLVEADGSAQSSGTLYRQDTSVFSSSGFSGSYVFVLSGVDTNNRPNSIVGRFTSDGNGHIVDGVLDQNENCKLSEPVFFDQASYQLDATYGFSYGRSTVSINGMSFIVYFVDRTRAEFLQTNYPAVSVGEAYSQESFSNTASVLSGNYAFLMSGRTDAGSVVRGGRFTADGNGNLGSLVMVENRNGTAAVVPPTGALTGTYAIDSRVSGRGTLTFTDLRGAAYTYVFYLASGGKAVFLDTSKGFVGDGSFLAQTASNISNGSLAGSYSMSWRDIGTGTFSLTGQINLSPGSSSNASGTMDYNDSGGLNPNLANGGALILSGDGAAKNTLSIIEAGNTSKSFHFAAFAIDSDSLFLVGTDKDHVLAGSTIKQD